MNDAQAQSYLLNDTLYWHGGWCPVCGTDYACSTGIYDTAWNGGNQTFTDPMPIGAYLTGITVAVCEADCGASNVLVNVDGNLIGTYAPTGSCACYGSVTYSVSGMIGNYVYQGINTLKLSPDSTVCVSHAVVTFAFNLHSYVSSNPLTPLHYCQGSAISIPFTAQGFFNNDNVFTAELSDSSGSFAPPDTLGTLVSTTSGTITSIIPINTISGTHYRIRVNSSDTSMIGINNGADITIGEPVPVITTNGPTTLCYGDSVTLDAGTYPTYIWSNGSTTQTITVNTAGNYSVTVTGNYGCSDSSAITTVVVNTNYNQNVSASICQGNTFTFPDGSMITATIDTIQTSHFTAINSCDSSIITTLTIQNVDTSVTVSIPTFTSNATGATYQWIDCNTMDVIPGAVNESYSAISNGSYAVIVTQNGCTDTSSCYDVLNYAINENHLETTIYVYPDPANTVLNIHLSSNSQFSSLPSLLLVTDVLGNNIYCQPINNLPQSTIYISEWNNGIYFYQIRNDKETLRGKFVVEK